MKDVMKPVGRWLLEHSLWIISLGLMLASSGIDGAYMAKWMPTGWGWLGLVLNTMSDVASMLLTYWYGRLQQDRSKRKQSWSRVLLIAETVMIAYSWFFSWRQLRIILPAIELQDWVWVSAFSAGFIPLLLAAIGYAQALLAGRIENERKEQPIAADVQQVAERPTATINDWRTIIPSLNGNRGKLTAHGVQQIVLERGFAAPSPRTLANWAQIANTHK